MGACTLHIGSRVVLVSEDGPSTAEFALFDPSDIELAQSEPGIVRESGYRTTAGEALRRLAVGGVTIDLAEEAAACIRGRIAEWYARGPVVRRLVSRLGPAELFDGGTYDAQLRRYNGAFLDLPLLADDAEISSATGLLQAMSLVALLSEQPGDVPVVLATLGYTESVRLGERTMRRRVIDGAHMVPRALRALADRAPSSHGDHVGQGPSREAILNTVRDRLAACSSTSAREHLQRLERALLHERERPSQGPLSDPELWSLERQLTLGANPGDVLAAVEAREHVRGREPATVYLRARAALLLQHESPRLIAQRLAPIAMSSSGNFPEVELLVAQAWDAAGETRNALPYARDLVSNPRAHDELRASAEAILRGPRVSLDAPMGERDFEAAPEGGLRAISLPPPTPRRSEPPRSVPPPYSQSTAQLDPPTPPFGFMARSGSSPSGRVPASSRPSSEPSVPRTLTPPQVHVMPGPGQERRPTPPERMASPLPPRTQSGRPTPISIGAPRLAASTPPPIAKQANQPNEEPPPTQRPQRLTNPPPSAIVVPASWPARMPAPREENVAPEEIERTPGVRPSTRYMRGASMPPMASEPPPKIPRAPFVPRVDIYQPELIETLALPRGADELPTDARIIPRTPLEARLRFTLDARELARRYRHELGIELRVQARAVMSMQRHLHELFPERVVRTAQEAREAELHGALLSELIARITEGEWVDISPSELGYWTMTVPMHDGSMKRVWPFGRVLRFIATGGEDDLVGFFRRLQELI